jgi:phosphomevalonate kinase
MLAKKDLDKETQEELKGILDKSPEELDDYQRAFLNARIEYLSTKEKELFREVMSHVDMKKVMEKITEEPVKKIEPKKKPFIKK